MSRPKSLAGPVCVLLTLIVAGPYGGLALDAWGPYNGTAALIATIVVIVLSVIAVDEWARRAK